MSIEKHILNDNPASIVFDPVPSYEGEWLFVTENLRKNAKKVDGKNLYEEFYKKTLLDPLIEIFKNPQIANIFIGMVSMPNSNNIGRCLKYSKIDFFINFINFLNCEIDSYGLKAEEKKARINSLINLLNKDNETLNLGFSEALREKGEKLKDVLEKEINSEYYEAAMLDYAPYEGVMDFSSYIKLEYSKTEDFQNGMLRLGDFLDTKVDFNELYRAFDPDKFFLLFAKNVYEFNLHREENEGVLDSSYVYLVVYKLTLEKMVQDNKKYNPTIYYTLSNGQKIKYSRWQFQKEFEEITKRHPEAKTVKLPDLEGEDLEKYRDINLMEKLKELYNQSTEVNWEFLPKGVGIKKGEQKSNKNSFQAKDRDSLVEEVNMRINILENSGYIGTPIKGINTFNGYYAFVYPNGKVILEKFWENEDAMRPASGSATFIMTIDNFVEMSKMSKINLIEYIKNLPDGGVKRKYHTSINNWHRNLYNEINGTYRLKDAIEFVSSLNAGKVNNGK